MFTLLSQVFPNDLVNIIDEYLGQMVLVNLTICPSFWNKGSELAACLKTTLYCSSHLWNRFSNMVFSPISSYFVCDRNLVHSTNVVIKIVQNRSEIDAFSEKLKSGQNSITTKSGVNLVTALAAHLLSSTDHVKFADLY